MELRIISPLDEEKYDIAWLEVNTPAGNFIIQPGHVPMVLTLSPETKLSFCLDNGKQQSRIIERGIAEINRETATVLVSKIV